MEAPVELLSFQGPHFGDRSGIANATLNPLLDKNIPILAAGCTGASVYIVVPENQAEVSKQHLEKVFNTP